MATGFSNKVVGQTGEFAVCAQLGKLGLVATPFAGNLPHFDIIATNQDLKSVPIQVKANFGNDTWQLGDARDWLEIDFNEATGKQTIVGLKAISNPTLITVYIWLSKLPGEFDRYFLLRKLDVQQQVMKGYSAWLTKHNGVRPKKPDSFHLALSISDLVEFENNWNLVKDALAT